MKSPVVGSDGLRMRDLGTVVACAMAIYVALQVSRARRPLRAVPALAPTPARCHCTALTVIWPVQMEGDFEIAHAHHIPLDTAHYQNGQFPDPHERLPPPLVADVDGDGQNELIVATRDPGIRIMRVPRSMKLREDDPPPAPVIASATLLSFTRVAKGRHPVALSSGYIDPFRSDGPPRKQVIVVVTEDWTVLCFSHTLDLLWETTVAHLQDTLGLGALYHREIAVRVVPTPIRDGDKGVVVVAGSLELRHAHHVRGPAAPRMG